LRTQVDGAHTVRPCSSSARLETLVRPRRTIKPCRSFKFRQARAVGEKDDCLWRQPFSVRQSWRGPRDAGSISLHFSHMIGKTASHTMQCWCTAARHWDFSTCASTDRMRLKQKHQYVAQDPCRVSRSQTHLIRHTGPVSCQQEPSQIATVKTRCTSETVTIPHKLRKVMQGFASVK
jgi:hypothetical protein